MSDIIVTCEHATGYIPEELLRQMQIPADLPEHRWFDRGALESAQKFSELTGAKLFAYSVSRLLTDANRSMHNRNVFSKYAGNLPEQIQLNALYDHYIPFRKAVYDEISGMKNTLHLSFHSYTGELYGKVRNYEIGILYDPKRKPEAETAAVLIANLKKDTGLRVRANMPYKGNADGHTTSLRKQFPEKRYSGIEIELSQELTTNRMITLAAQMSAYF